MTPAELQARAAAHPARDERLRQHQLLQQCGASVLQHGEHHPANDVRVEWCASLTQLQKDVADLVLCSWGGIERRSATIARRVCASCLQLCAMVGEKLAFFVEPRRNSGVREASESIVYCVLLQVLHRGAGAAVHQRVGMHDVVDVGRAEPPRVFASLALRLLQLERISSCDARHCVISGSLLLGSAYRTYRGRARRRVLVQMSCNCLLLLAIRSEINACKKGLHCGVKAEKSAREKPLYECSKITASMVVRIAK
jgi:hypothetical protein